MNILSPSFTEIWLTNKNHIYLRYTMQYLPCVDVVKGFDFHNHKLNKPYEIQGTFWAPTRGLVPRQDSLRALTGSPVSPSLHF